MRELFNRIDTDSSDNLSLKEVVLFFKSVTDDLSDDNIEHIFNRLDSNEDKNIDFEEFMVRIILVAHLIFHIYSQNLFNEISFAGWRQVGQIDRQQIKEEEVLALFNMIDTDRNGFLTVKVCNISSISSLQ